MALEFSPETLKKFEATVARYPKKEAAMLPVLYLAQQEFGHLGPEAIEYVAQLMDQPPVRVHGVVSFYTMYNMKPIGRHHIQVCRTLPCALRGAERVTEELMTALGIEPNGTDASGTFTLMEVECLGACDRAPLVMVNDSWHECLEPEGAKKLVDDLRARGEAALTGCHHEAPDRESKN